MNVLSLILIAALPDAWLGARLSIDTHEVTLPQSKRTVRWVSAANESRVEGAPPLVGAFFVFDAKGTLVAGPLEIDARSRLGCTELESVTGLRVVEDEVDHAFVAFLPGDQRCGLSLTKRGASLFPDESKSLVANFPKLERHQQGLEFTALTGLSWVIGTRGQLCEFEAFDPFTGEAIDSAPLKQKVCRCLEDVGYQGLLSFRSTAPHVGALGAGTSIPTCECGFNDEPGVVCEISTGRPYSPTELEDMELPAPPVSQSAELALSIATANQQALGALRDGQTIEAIDTWKALYRQWLLLGRPTEQIALWAEVLNNLGFALAKTRPLTAERLYEECTEQVVRGGLERNVLNLNRGDLHRAMGKKAEARVDYERYLEGKISASQRKAVTRILKGL